MNTFLFFNHKKVLSLLLSLAIMLMITGAVLAQSQPEDINFVRSLDAEKTGLSSPGAIVFSSRANLFHVVEAQVDSIKKSDGLLIKNISVFGNYLGSTSLNVADNYPILLAMDNHLNRLLIYQVDTSQLFEVQEDAKGKIDPNTLTSYDLSYINLLDPTGMTIDQTHDTLYILDAAYPRLVRVASSSGGNFTRSAVQEIKLSWAGSNELQGIAFDSVSGNLYTINLNKQVLYEFTGSGDVVAYRDISDLDLTNPQAIVYAPSGDQTDDPDKSSIFLVDSGLSKSSQLDSAYIDNAISPSNSGKIVELSMDQSSVQAVINFSSTLVKTTYTSEFSPPSPDPAGITYIGSDVPADRRLLISDADVEETKEGFTYFNGVNLWEVTLGGSVQRTANISTYAPTYVPMTNEPTGVAWNPGSGHFYFSDDNAQTVYDLNPGIDGLVGTADDSWTSFELIAENGDPEGIAYDSWHDQLYVIDGTNLEVYVYTLSGVYISHFDVAVLGALDTESLEFNPISGTFFILSNLSSRNIYEIEVQYSATPTDTLIITPTQTIDMSSVLALDPSGITYAPASNGSGVMRFYVVERGVDNGADPYENDGKLYELTAPEPIVAENTPPSVNAGPNQNLAFGETANLVGSVDDDGNPNPPGAVSTLWTKSSGPGTVIFGDAGLLSTTATFSATGTYALRLTADDGEFSTYDELNVNVTSTAGSSIIEIRLVSSSDDAEESATGVVSLVSPDLELVLDANLQTVGMRFNEVNLPKNAIIDNAYVQFESRETGSSSISLTIRGEAQDDPGTFVNTDLNISSRTKTVASVGWSPAAWTVVNQAGVDQRTTNIKTVLQEIISRPGWSEGNSMVIIINGTSGRRTAWSYDGLPSGAPRLHIEYTLSDNHAPVANNDSYTTNEDTQLAKNPSSGVLSNDTDADSDPLTATKYTNPAHGSLTFRGNGSFDYLPEANYYGPDSFTYYCNDGEFNSNIATVNITVNPINDAPVADSQSVSTIEDTPVDITLTASDVDDTTLIWSIVAAPAHGSLSGTPPEVTYHPGQDYNGGDSFTFKVNDGHVDSNIATVSITITPVNDAPVANSQSVSTDEDTAKAITLTASDADNNPLTWTIVTTPTNGTLSGTAPALTYTPFLNYFGNDSFTFKVNDGSVDSNIATVNITVNPINDAPVADSQSVSTIEDTPVDITLTASDVDDTTLIWSIVAAPAHGLLSGTPPEVTYHPGQDYTGDDSFTFKVNDGHVDSNIATVSITITPVNDAPVANSQSVSTDEDTAKAITLTASDADNNPLTWTIVTTPTNGTLSGTAPVLTYTPYLNFHGDDSFTFKVNDGSVDSNIATVNITVASINDAPIAVGDSYTTDENDYLVEDAPGVLGNDSDIDGDLLTAVVDEEPAHGELTLNLNGSFVYVPDEDYFGTDVFTYHATDGDLDSNIVSVTITIIQTKFYTYLPAIMR